MAIEFPQDTKQRMIESIRRYVAENLDEDIGDLQAMLLLDFVVREIGPTIYNRAIADAQAQLHDRVDDLEGSCHEPEFGFWDR